MRRLALIFFCLFGPVEALAETRVPTSQTEIALSFAPLVKKAAPAVVNIYARRVVAQQRTPMQNDPFFGNLFRDLGPPRPRVQNSLGSGVILSADGIVVSNYHVVGMATDIRVVLNDRREYSAKVLLGDQDSDLAILQMQDAAGMPYLPLRDSDSVEVGELALAIGNPFGIGQTVSSGIVSGLARSGTATGNARGYFIQTDAAINPGNSGGALIDVTGALIGINTSILTRSGGSNGIGFAIPSALVSQFVDQAKAGNRQFQRPWAGMTGQSVSPDMSEAFGFSAPEGVIISYLHGESPFLASGLKPGDVVLAVDGQRVNTPAEMLYRMSVAGIGREALIRRLRDGVEQDMRVRMIAPPDSPARNAVTLTEAEALPGLAVARANPSVIAEFGLPLTTQGVVITDAGPLGARAGLQRGDILLQIAGQDITAPQDVRTAFADRARGFAVLLQRGGRRIQLRFRF